MSNSVAAAPVFGAEIETPTHGRGWFTRLVRRHIQRRGHHTHLKVQSDDHNAHERAHAATRWACIKAAATGAAAGALSTGATLITAQSAGAMGLVAVPLASLAIGGEMVMRAMLHVNLTWDLAEIYGVRFNPTDDDDVWRLYALAFETHEHEEGSEDPGRQLVHDVGEAEGEDIGHRIGKQVLGESVMRNIIPFVGIISSAVTNYVMTRRLGETMRHYMRYQRAISDSFGHATELCEDHLGLLIEGIWFLFSADGKLLPEEAAILAHLLTRLGDDERLEVTHRFVEDEHDWALRVTAQIPEEHKDVFMHALEVAAAVDKSVSLPERKILRRAARALGRPFDPARLERLMAEFNATGVLRQPHPQNSLPQL
jgi:hypothetical protein